MLRQIVSAALLTLLSGPALAQSTPAPSTPAPNKPLNLKITVPTEAASKLAIDLGSATGGRLLPCPSKLKVTKVTAQALCLDVPQNAASTRTAVSNKLGSRVSGDWKVAGKASSLLAQQSGNTYLVLLAQLGDKETLMVIDQAAAQRSKPAGVVSGELYLLGSDLAGLVKVSSLGAGQYRLERNGQPTLTVTAGKTGATLGKGTVELPLAPASDGKNLLLPFSALRALGCTATPNSKVLTVACGTDSVGIKPIVF